MDLKEVEILGDNIQDHWYYVSKARAMCKFLNNIKVPEVLDVGAGSGFFSRQLLDSGICDIAYCIDPYYEEEKTENHNGKELHFIKATDKSCQKLILMMDVIEHVPDDVAFIEAYAKRLEPGGKILITVPAFQFIWSGHDVFLEHYRRYTRQMLDTVVFKAGLTPVKSRYYFASLFPVVAAGRIIKNSLRSHGKLESKSELTLYPGWLNRALTTLHDIERHTLFEMNEAFGLSLFCLCEKASTT